jgi:hypothetical protein
MNIPEGIIELTVVSVVGFIFKVVFGLIGKNEQKSDEADQRLEGEIKTLRTEMRDTENRHRENENSLFEKSADQREDVAEIKARIDCIKGS